MMKETADIVEQLRKSVNTIYSQDGYTFRLGLHNEAADEIERLREALRVIRDELGDTPMDSMKAYEIADAALKGDK